MPDVQLNLPVDRSQAVGGRFPTVFFTAGDDTLPGKQWFGEAEARRRCEVAGIQAPTEWPEGMATVTEVVGETSTVIAHMQTGQAGKEGGFVCFRHRPM